MNRLRATVCEWWGPILVCVLICAFWVFAEWADSQPRTYDYSCHVTTTGTHENWDCK